MSAGLDMERFEELLDRLGPDIDMWPEADRQAARALLARSIPARHALDAARLVESVLAEPAVPASVRLRQAVLDIPLAEPRQARALGLLDRLAAMLGESWRMATAGAGMAMATGLLGFVLGYGQWVQLPGLTATDTETAAATPEQELALLLDGLYELEDVQ